MNLNNINIKTIYFHEITGFKLAITATKDTSIKDLIKKYLDRRGLSESNIIGKDIIFLMGATTLNTNSQETIAKFKIIQLLQL